MLQSRVFRIFVAALGVACAIACVLIIASGFSKADTGRTIVAPRYATATEIATAALEGQVEALRKAGFDETCLSVTGMYGKLCIEQCVSDGTAGFSLELYTDYPKCHVKSCTCEGETPEPLHEGHEGDLS